MKISTLDVSDPRKKNYISRYIVTLTAPGCVISSPAILEVYVLKSELSVFQDENDPDLVLKLLQLLLTKAPTGS